MWANMGADPEIALVSAKTGSFRNPTKFMGATPLQNGSVPGNLYSKGSNHIDGFLVELNPAPSTCREYVLDNLRACISTVMMKVADKDLTLSAKSTIKVPKQIREEATQQELELGCEEDYSIYSGKANIIPKQYEKGATRTGGGHIHIGKNDVHRVLFYEGTEPHNSPSYKPVIERVIKSLDYLCGLPGVIAEDENGGKRRKIYGKAGAYRLPAHGIEYRVLSNWWMHHPALASLALLLAREAVGYGCGGDRHNRTNPDQLFKAIPEKDVQQVINEGNKEEAKKMVPIIKPFLEQVTKDPALEFILLLDKVGREELFHPNLLDNWAISVPKIGFVGKNRWSSHNMGFCYFAMSHMKKEHKEELNKIIGSGSKGSYYR